MAEAGGGEPGGPHTPIMGLTHSPHRLRRIGAFSTGLWALLLGLHLAEQYCRPASPSWLDTLKFSTHVPVLPGGLHGSRGHEEGDRPTEVPAPKVREAAVTAGGGQTDQQARALPRSPDRAHSVLLLSYLPPPSPPHPHLRVLAHSPSTSPRSQAPHSFLAPPSHPHPAPQVLSWLVTTAATFPGQRPPPTALRPEQGSTHTTYLCPCFHRQLQAPRHDLGPSPGDDTIGRGSTGLLSLLLLSPCPVSEPPTWAGEWWLQAGPSPHGLATRAARCRQVLLSQGQAEPLPRPTLISLVCLFGLPVVQTAHETRRRQG